jgi:hypothetical protein
MKIQDALNILGIKPNSTESVIKAAYREACKKFHPDVNPAGIEMMKTVNEAYEALKGYVPVPDFEEDDLDLNFGSAFNDALKTALSLNITVEICGAWIWVSGNTFAVKDSLKEVGFKFAKKKKMWYFRSMKYKSKNRRSWNIDKIRDKHGSKKVKTERMSPTLAYA